MVIFHSYFDITRGYNRTILFRYQATRQVTKALPVRLEEDQSIARHIIQVEKARHILDNIYI